MTLTPSESAQHDVIFCNGLAGSNNIMYPKENKTDRKLVYACSRCSYQEDAQSGSCVYRNNLITTAGSVL